MMNNRLTRTGLLMVCLLTISLGAGSALADWSGQAPYSYYNRSYGDFPPLDIDQQLSGDSKTVDATEKNEPVDAGATTPAAVNRAASSPVRNYRAQGYPEQNYPEQNYSGQNQYKQNYSTQNGYARQPAYGGYNQYRNYVPANAQNYNRSNRFSGPWNNNRTGFSGPWNNGGSGFNGPWNNSGSNFTGPWNNNSSGFSMPWGNNGSGFNPMGNGGGW